MLPCGPIIVVEATNAADVERVLDAPPGATHLAYAAGGTITSAGLSTPIAQEMSWIEYNVAASAAKTSSDKIVMIRDRDGGVAQIDSFYYAGLAGLGEPLRASRIEYGTPMRLYVFLAGTQLPSGGRAWVRLQWATEAA